MKKWKICLSLLLVAAMFCMLFAACGTEEPAGNSGNQPGADSDGSTGDSEIDYGADDVDPEDIVDIYISYLDVEGAGDAYKHVEDAMNEITEKEIGVHVNLLYWDFGSYATQVSLYLSGGEQLDVVNVTPMGGTTLDRMRSQNQIIDASEYLNKYAAEAVAICGQYADVYRDGDALYGLPTNRIHAANAYWVMRRDVLEACGLVEDAQNASSWSDIEKIFAGVKDYCDANNIYVVVGQKSVVPTQALWEDSFDVNRYDNLGDGTSLLGVKDDRVFVLYEQPEVVAMMKRVNTWQDNGWIYPDSVLGDDHTDNLMKQGIAFSYNNSAEIGIEASKLASTGYECVCPITAKGMIGTESLSKFGVAIPVTAQEPEAAAKWINLLYTNSAVTTMFSWGVEGVDYVLNDQGEATFPEGGRTDYHEGDYMIGNQMLVPPWEGNGADFRQVAQKANDEAAVSPYLGLLINTDGLDTVIASLSAARDEFRPNLLCGMYSDELNQQFLDKLYSVGLQDYLDSVQAQIDAFLASK